MIEAGKFVGGLKAAGVGGFAGVTVNFPWGSDCSDKGFCSNNGANELCQKGL
jgi:hypothetical protein